MIRICFISCYLLLVASVFAQESDQVDINRQFSVEALQEDFNLMRRNIETVEAGLYEYTSKADLDHFLDDLYQQINEPMSGRAFYNFLLPILGQIKNGHNAIFPSLEELRYIRSKGKFFPLDIAWIQNRMYVVENASENQLITLGTEISTINGMDVKVIFENFIATSSTDGYNRTNPERDVAKNFKIVYGRNIGYPEKFELSCISEKGKVFNTSVNAMLSDSIKASKKQKAVVKPPLEIAYMMDSIAILNIRSFSSDEIEDGGFKYKKFLKETFAEIKSKNVKHLILDVRSNGGGDDGYGNLLFSYLYDKEFTYYKEIKLITNKLPKDFKTYKLSTVKGLEYNRFALNSYLKLMTKKENGNYVFKKNDGLGVFKPQKDVYTNDLYILTDGFSFSATGEFAGCAAHYKRGVFIGEEVGGNQHKNTSGINFPIELPNTGLIVFIPIFQYVMDIEGNEKGRGVVPDHIIVPTLEDILNKKDKVLEYTIDLIQK